MFSVLASRLRDTLAAPLGSAADVIAGVLAPLGLSHDGGAIVLTVMLVMLAVWFVSLVIDLSEWISRHGQQYDMKLLFSLRFAVLGVINTATLGAFLIAFGRAGDVGDALAAIGWLDTVQLFGLIAVTLFTMYAMAVANVFGLLFSLWQWLLSWFAIFLVVPCLIVAVLRPATQPFGLLAENRFVNPPRRFAPSALPMAHAQRGRRG